MEAMEVDSSQNVAKVRRDDVQLTQQLDLAARGSRIKLQFSRDNDEVLL